MMTSRRVVLACALAFAAPLPVSAQSQPPSSQALKDPTACGQSKTAEPATKPAPASADGTAPGNAGSTGWSGGTGGSLIGTTPSGASKDSQTYQPATARGLDPISAAPKPVGASC